MARVSLTSMYIDFVEPKLEEIAHYRAMGATKEELASYLGVTKDTFRKLSNKFPFHSIVQ